MTGLFGKKVIFFGAHTDDEIVAAGTLHRLVREGVDVRVVAFGPAATQNDRVGSEKSSEILQVEFDKSLSLIGVSPSYRIFYNMIPSGELEDRAQRVRQLIYNTCESWKPDTVITLSPEDENPSHAVVGRQCESVLRGRVATAIRCVFPWNYGHGRPNLYVSLNPEDMEVKRKVINAYQSQKPKDSYRYDYEQILMSMAVADGKSVKVDAAEKFEIVRSVI